MRWDVWLQCDCQSSCTHYSWADVCAEPGWAGYCIMWRVTLSFITANRDPRPGFPLKNICLIRLRNAICVGRDKVVVVAHSISHHYVTLESLGHSAGRHTCTDTCTGLHTLPPDSSRSGQPFFIDMPGRVVGFSKGELGLKNQSFLLFSLKAFFI